MRFPFRRTASPDPGPASGEPVVFEASAPDLRIRAVPDGLRFTLGHDALVLWDDLEDRRLVRALRHGVARDGPPSAEADLLRAQVPATTPLADPRAVVFVDGQPDGRVRVGIRRRADPAFDGDRAFDPLDPLLAPEAPGDGTGATGSRAPRTELPTFSTIRDLTASETRDLADRLDRVLAERRGDGGRPA